MATLVIFRAIIFLSFQIQLRTSGYSEAQLMEICAALTVLAKYGILATLGLGGTHTVQNYLSFAEQGNAVGTNASVFGPIGGQVTISDCLGNISIPFQTDAFRSSTTSPRRVM